MPPQQRCNRPQDRRKFTTAVESLHENRGILGPEILGRHRVISTLMEELQAIDRYNQRIQAATIRSSGRSRRHNRNEEAEHASMLLAWLRRMMSASISS
jgi:uncharacterized protein